MKQIDECLTRAIEGKNPLPSKKWKAFVSEYPSGQKLLLLYHYHHQVLLYDLKNKSTLAEWWEKPADKRGLDSAKKWLDEQSGSLAAVPLTPLLLETTKN